MQINNWFDFVISTLFTFAVILIGLPASVYLIKKGIEGFVKYKFAKLPNDFLIAQGLGNYPIQVFLYGLFLVAFSVWFLFFDRGGQFSNYIIQVTSFFKKG
jgi:hypothetical protein